MKSARNVLCMLLLLCLAAAALTGCLAVSSEVPKKAVSVPEPSAESFARPSAQEPSDRSDAREALLHSPAWETDDLAVCGEVGVYTLCYLPFGGDAAIAEVVLAGYRIVSPTVGYPSATHLYLVGDDAIYTLRAAYTQGLIEDMGVLYALLPENMQGGCDPDAEDSLGWEDTDWFGFADGVYRPD